MNYVEQLAEIKKEKDISNIVISTQRSLGKTINEFYSLKDYEKEKITKEIQKNYLTVVR